MKYERMTRVTAAPRLRGWMRLFFAPFIWIMMLSGVFIGPSVRSYSTADYVMWVGVAVIFPIAMWMLLASRYRRVYMRALRATNGSFWIFAGGILVPPPSDDGGHPRARALSQGWINTSLGHVVVVEDGDSLIDAPPVVQGKVQQVSLVRLMRLFFEPVTRIVCEDGTRIDLTLVRPGLKDVIGMRMSDYLDLERSLTTLGPPRKMEAW